ncbi:MAG: hypothetical protein HZB41_13210 [Ignavibacteriae bacterium]|nr:hypothetical protein [Ignavibacteriota bacterium]
MQSVNIAQNDSTIFLSFDKTSVSKEKINIIESLIMAIVNDIHFVDDEEQLEYEKVYDNLNEDDLKPGSTVDYSL